MTFFWFSERFSKTHTKKYTCMLKNRALVIRKIHVDVLFSIYIRCNTYVYGKPQLHNRRLAFVNNILQKAVLRPRLPWLLIITVFRFSEINFAAGEWKKLHIYIIPVRTHTVKIYGVFEQNLSFNIIVTVHLSSFEQHFLTPCKTW